MGTSDYWTIGGLGGSDAGQLNITTYDNGDEPIVFTQNEVPGGGGINERMRISSNGYLGIVTPSPSSKLSLSQSANSATNGLWIAGTDGDFRSLYMSDTSGTLSFQGGNTAGTYNTATLDVNGALTNASDRAYKENIVDLSTKYGLSTILQTSPRFYTMKGSGNPQVGFIAQELKLLIPEVVDGEEGSYSLSYGNLVAVAFEGIKELN